MTDSVEASDLVAVSNHEQAPFVTPLWIAVALCFVVGLWIDLGSFHRYHNSDSVLYVLQSLYHWTPFAWGTDRNGQLVSLLATPIASPFYNLLFQTWLQISCGLLVHFLLCRYVIRGRGWFVTGAVSAALFVALFDREECVRALETDQPYVAAFALALAAALWVVHKPASRVAWWGALLVLVVAHWLNWAVSLWLLPVVVVRSFVYSNSPLRPLLTGEVARLFFLCLASFTIGFSLRYVEQTPTHQMDFLILQPQLWPKAWGEVVRSAGAVAGPTAWAKALAALAALGCVAIGLRARKPGTWAAVRPALVLVGAGLCYGQVVAGSHFAIGINGANFRYVWPALLLAQLGVVCWAVVPVLNWCTDRWAKILAALVPLVLVAGATIGFGLPSIAGVRADLHVRIGKDTPSLLRLGATHFAGDYWRVWPAVLHANMLLYDAGADRVIWGVSSRAEVTMDQWSVVANARYACVEADPRARQTFRHFSFPSLRAVARDGELVVLVESEPR